MPWFTIRLYYHHSPVTVTIDAKLTALIHFRSNSDFSMNRSAASISQTISPFIEW